MLFHNKEQMYEISPLLFPSLVFIAFTKMIDGFISLVWCLHIYLSMYFFGCGDLKGSFSYISGTHTHCDIATLHISSCHYLAALSMEITHL